MQNIVIKSEHKRLVYGEVYSPLQVDTDEEAMLAEEIEKMAHRFLSEGRTNKIDTFHNFEEAGCVVVESFIARKDDPDGFIEGSWVLGVKVIPDEIWDMVLKGEINGFSWAGTASTRKISTTVTVTRKMVGESEKSEDGLLPPHDHEIDIEFNENGKIVKGEAKERLGHSHAITHTTATESEMEHSHRLILIEN